MTKPRFLLDEHVWHGLIRIALENGSDAVPVQTFRPEGTDDEEVLALAADQGRILLTSNAEDFGPLAEEWFFPQPLVLGPPLLHCPQRRTPRSRSTNHLPLHLRR
jgi:predicted nuclease of predicted toxin-antitoxin system